VVFVNAYKRVKRGWSGLRSVLADIEARSSGGIRRWIAAQAAASCRHASRVRRLRSSFNIATFSGAQRPDGERI
jgi:hypothetical protein